MFIKLSWDLLAPSACIAFDCLIGVYANLTPCSLSSNGDMVWSCRNKQNRGFRLFLFGFFAMEILKWRELCRRFSVRGRTFPWFGENISSLLSEQRLPQYFWVAMAAESIFILAFSVLWRFLLLLPAGESKCSLHRERVTSSVVPARDARSAVVQVGWDVPGSAKLLTLSRAQLYPGAQLAVTSSCCWLQCEGSWCFQTSHLAPGWSCCFPSLLPKTHQQRQAACYPIKSVCAKEKP